MKNWQKEMISWLAAITILSGFCSVSLGVVKAQMVSYQVLNVLGGGLFVWYGFLKKAWAIVVLNAIYAGAAVYFLINILLKGGGV